MMSKERELIKDMKILLECTDMGGLQRPADALIGRAIKLLAQPEPFKPDWAAYRQGVEDAKREPLSDEDIQVWYSQHTWAMDKQEYMWGFRDAELAHGIRSFDDE